MKTAKPCLVLSLFTWVTFASALAGQEVHVPDVLDDWVGWVLHGNESSLCPPLLIEGGDWEPQTAARVCGWPGTLVIDTDVDGADFNQAWELYGGSGWIALPGNARYWPESVQLDGGRALVVARGDRPFVRATAGRHRVSGRIRWDARPQELPVDSGVGLIRLRVDGRTIANPQRSRHGLWLGERPRSSETRDHLSMTVHRLVRDEVPTRLATRIRIEASGAVREVSLGPVLPQGFTPLGFDSDLPARLEPDGRLRLQVRPGTWVVVIEARAETVVDELTRPVADEGWVDTEIWSLESDPRLRVVMPVAGRPVDPSQSDVPPEWADHPAFALAQGESMRLEERSRGEVERDNRLTLHRTLWLDFDREAFTARDAISGAMFSGWRLSMPAPFELLSAYDEAQADHLLVNELDDPPARSVELRQSALSLTTVARVPRDGALPVAGWQQELEGVDVRLHLPPGFRLLGAPGAEAVSGSWWSQWHLHDMFLALFVCVTAGKLFGRRVGALALVAMVLGAHENGAPSWAWLNLLAAAALVRYAPEGRLRTVARGYGIVSVVAIVAWLAPFVAGQLKLAIYPQLESAAAERVVFDALATESADAVPRTTAHLLALGSVGSPAAKSTAPYQRYAPDALVQTGPGIPDWRWSSYSLSWSGPVGPEERYRLLIAPPVVVSIWRVVLVAALVVLLFVIVRGSLPPGEGPFGLSLADLRRAHPGAAALLLVCGLALWAAPAGSQVPPAEILAELEERLTAPPPCSPDCVELVGASVTVAGETLTIELRANALALAAIQLPGSDDTWLPTSVVVDGSSVAGVHRDTQARYWIALPAGRHEIILRGTLPAVETLSIPFERRPRIITVTGRGWKVTGIEEHRLVSGALELTRIARAGDETEAARWETNRFPAFVRVRRELLFDLDWTVETTVERLAPEEGAISMRISLLEGESVTSQGIAVEEGAVLAALSARQASVAWRSTLERSPSLTLSAPTDEPREEVWVLAASNIWHLVLSGVPADQANYENGGAWRPVFHPRPGETLVVEVERPAAARGATLAIDSVRRTTRLGSRSRATTLAFDYRSTRGSQQVVTLAEGARVSSVSVDGESLPLQADAGRLRLPIRPGAHRVEVEFVEGVPISLSTHAADVDLGTPASNLHTRIEVPENRWILATGGEGVGPAVLYWSELAALALFAFLLGRTRATPLDGWQWFLLGLGFSTFSWGALAIVVVWVLVIAWRERAELPEAWWRYDLIQVALAVATLAALVTLFGSISVGLLGRPDMHIVGLSSDASSLNWFLDRTEGVLPDARVVSVPLWIYKAAILAWALWLSFALLRWLPWVWRSLSRGGLWKPRKTATT